MMKVSLKFYIGIFLLFIMAFVMIFLKIAPASSNSIHSAIIDESMDEVVLQRYDKEGQINQIVTMHSCLHYQGQIETQMIYPFLQIFHSDGSKWDISAKKGEGIQPKLNGHFEQLRLSEQVLISQQNQANNDNWQLKTLNLLFFPDQSLALTDAPVAIYGRGIEVHAKGMRAQLADHSVQFLNDVTSRYEKS